MGVGSSDFWSNRIRKDFKGKDDETSKLQVAFCDTLKATIVNMGDYIEKYHKTGLTFNPKGVSMAETAIRLTDNPLQDAAVEATRKKDQKQGRRSSSLGTTIKGGNMLGLVSELADRQSEDGSSAATGLKKVTKEQQTWRKEFKGEGKNVQMAPSSSTGPKKPEKKKKVGLPVLEYQERGFKWVIENHDQESAKKVSDTGILEVEILDAKHQVYIYNCEEVTIKIKGDKFKSIVIDKCEKVNCKKIAVQSESVCPVFSIDKTVGVSIYLSKESASISSFTTSMSSEMNVSIIDGDDCKEIPIPEQFVHKVADGSVTSEVSDLYK